MATVIPLEFLQKKLPKKIILYGHLVSDIPGLVNNKYRYPTLAEFAALIAWWRGLGYSFVGLQEYQVHDDRKKILLTFDDGFKVLAGPVADYLESENIPSVIFILSDPFEDPQFGKKLLGDHITQTSELLFLSISEIEMLKRKGVHIGFHTRSHVRLNNSSSVDNASILEQLTIPEAYAGLLSEPRCFAYPYQAPEVYEKMDTAIRGLGYQLIFDTKGFRHADGTHHFRVSIDGAAGLKRKNWLKWMIKRQLLYHFLNSRKR